LGLRDGLFPFGPFFSDFPPSYLTLFPGVSASPGHRRSGFEEKRFPSSCRVFSFLSFGLLEPFGWFKLSAVPGRPSLFHSFPLADLFGVPPDSLFGGRLFPGSSVLAPYLPLRLFDIQAPSNFLFAPRTFAFSPCTCPDFLTPMNSKYTSRNTPCGPCFLPLSALYELNFLSF